ncbi:MAG: AmmeMemoRadiSam system radical SAM enzyme [Bacteroidales bacterium]|jgi:pyruvate formate lyase activating enzyme|nr:AmmeMemoRadiSam system radical SAM enzyme [Bacteroidales bacterium]
MKDKISKRQFLKSAALGSCGMALGFSQLEALGNIIPDRSALPDDELWKWSREAMHYIETPRGIKCKLCPQACELKEGETGDCRTRIVKDSKLHTIAYGNPCAIHIDPIEKKPLYHFLPASSAFSIATAGCNLACLNCQNWNISQSSPRDTRNYDLMPDKTVNECKKNDCASIAYTYSDPIAFYEYTFDTARIARQEGIKNVFISAGYIHETPLREIAKYLDGANIDLKSFENDIYEMLNAGTLEPVLDTLRILRDEGVWLEITNLVVPTWTDDMDMIRRMCGWLASNGFEDNPLHFSRFHPMYKLTNLPATPHSTLKEAREIALSEGMHYVYIGNVPGSGAENTICHHCGEIAIERKGYTVLQNNITDGKCDGCGNEIPGLWD